MFPRPLRPPGARPHRRLSPLSLPVMLWGCAPDYAVQGRADGLAARGALQLLPAHLELPAALSGDHSEAPVELWNTGSTALSGLELRFAGDAAFDVIDVNLSEIVLPPGDSLTLTVRGSPGPDGAAGWLSVGAGGVEATAELSVTGLQPALRVGPSPLRFDPAPDGCAPTGTLWVENIGDVPIQVEQLSAIGEGFVLEPGPTGALAPGEEWPLTVRFEGTTPGPAEGSLWVRTDLVGDQVALLRAQRLEAQFVVEEMVQDGPWPAVDLILVADRSGSMADDLTAIGAEAERLFAALGDRSPGALVSVVTRDDGCLSAGPLSPEAPESRQALADGLLGPWGRKTEAGMSLGLAALQAAQPGGCNAGLLREDARPVMVFISDEAEQSEEGWRDRLNGLLRAAPDLQVLAVVGPGPDGCATANVGHGYLEAVEETGGSAWSICASDWGALAEALGSRAAGAAAERWPLETPARPESLQLELDGQPWHDWRFDPETNAVLFNPDSPPPPGAALRATYEAAEACDGAGAAG